MSGGGSTLSINKLRDPFFFTFLYHLFCLGGSGGGGLEGQDTVLEALVCEAFY